MLGSQPRRFWGSGRGKHLRNPPPASAAAASLRPGELSARPARLPERRQPPAALAPRRRAASASGGAVLGPGIGVGRRAPAERRATPWSSALAPLQGQVSGCGDSGVRARGGRGERSRAGRELTPLPCRS